VIVTVRNGIVESIRIERTGAPAPVGVLDFGLSVDGLFAEIATARSGGAHYLGVRYDADYGYPTYIRIDWVERFVDDEVTWVAGKFTVLD
jgi:Family of unknown function (DUF6174)